MWGANAVNGVINIITKRAAATQGGLLTAEFGSEEIIGGLRQGGKLGSTHYRVYGKYARRTPQALPSGRDAFDRWHLATSGFRIDATPSAKDDLTLQGDFYGGRLAEIDSSPVLGPPYARSTQGRVQEAGANVLGRWKHKLASGSETSLQMYFDRPPRSATDLHTVDTTADLEFQHHLQAGRRHDAVWGLGYRYIWSHSKGPFDIYLQPAARQRQVLNAFVQDEVSLIPNRLEVTFGGKLEHNDYTGFEFQPSVRLWWTPTRQQAWWAAWSRAVRTPSRFDTDAVINVAVFPGPPGGLNVISIRGNPDKKSEVLHAYELGYRARPSRNLYLDVTGFVHRYDHLTTVEPAAPFLERTPAPAHLVLPQRFDNLAQGRTFGAELAAGWSMTPQWRWNATYTWLGFDLRLKPASRAAEIDDPGRSPKHQFRVAGEVNLPRRFWWDYSMYFVSRLAAVPAYARLDTGVTRRFGEYLEVSLRGQNLAEGRHLEFADPEQTIAPTEIRRSVYGKVTWRF
jgi:iron complex outermembrane receptor protein